MQHGNSGHITTGFIPCRPPSQKGTMAPRRTLRECEVAPVSPGWLPSSAGGAAHPLSSREHALHHSSTAQLRSNHRSDLVARRDASSQAHLPKTYARHLFCILLPARTEQHPSRRIRKAGRAPQLIPA